MDNELLNKLDKIVSDLNDSSETKELIQLKGKILKNKELLDNINRLQNMEKNDKEYMTLKSKIFENEDYKRFKELENKLYYFSLETGSKLTSLTR